MGIKHSESSLKDRRVRKTRAALKKSLSSLLLQKNINDISVRELTEHADINRGTFYLHYRDVFDLLEQCEEDLLNEFRSTLDQFDETNIRCAGDSIQIFEKIYTLCYENADFVCILIGENGDIRFMNKLKELIRAKCFNEWLFIMRRQRPGFFDAYYAFIVGGSISMLQYWFSSGMKETPHQLALLTCDILSGTTLN